MLMANRSKSLVLWGKKLDIYYVSEFVVFIRRIACRTNSHFSQTQRQTTHKVMLSGLSLYQLVMAVFVERLKQWLIVNIEGWLRQHRSFWPKIEGDMFGCISRNYSLKMKDGHS